MRLDTARRSGTIPSLLNAVLGCFAERDFVAGIQDLAKLQEAIFVPEFWLATRRDFS